MKLLPPPGRDRNRQLTLLGLTVVAAAILVWNRWPVTTEPVAVASNPLGRSVDIGKLNLPKPIALEKLDAVMEDSEVGRNPFGFGVKPVPPPPPPPPPLPPPPPMPEAPPPPPPGPPMIALKLQGVFTHPETGKVTATLKDPATGGIFQAVEGEIVDGRYKVIKIGTMSVTVSYVDGQGQRTIPIGG